MTMGDGTQQYQSINPYTRSATNQSSDAAQEQLTSATEAMMMMM